MILRKKGQFWYMDFMVAIIVMAVIGILFIKTVMGMTQTKNLLDDVLLEAQEISENLVFSLTGENNKLDRDNVTSFTAGKSYSDMKKALGTNKEFYAYLNDGTNIKPFFGSKSLGKFKSEGDYGGWTTVAEVRTHVNGLITSKDIDNIVEINRLVSLDEGTPSDPKIKIYRLSILVWSAKGEIPP